ncbi:MAG: nucleotidyl transferase AbiEii/AbiGii toxin family protein [Verrucomicrobia bacterium]|nr:MAG: nucleotidyl transferase AbiEii/AbiGii toxin family protein [Verrucomicrobiota bacterium]
MISPAFITEWSQQCPWTSPAQVEQDLVLSRGLVEIYSDPELRKRLLFRGGTALHKIVLQPAARYSEDLDFVQLREEPIGNTLDLLRARLNPWLGEPRSDISSRGATLTYRFESELPPVIRLRLKIEINTREHISLYPIQQTQFAIDSRWFSGQATLPIYSTTELLGTKLRALYQRRKGRDLFDLWQAHLAGLIEPPAVVAAFQYYMSAENHTVSATEFANNLATKMKHPGFLSDTPPLLRPGVAYDPHEAHEWITNQLLPLINAH